MDNDARCKRGSFISKSTDIREMFNFAYPGQVLSAVSTYTCHFYGAMLWDLFGDPAGQVFRSWNTCVKLAWDVPRGTHNYFVDNLLSGSLPSVRERLLSQYVGFFQKFVQKCWEVRLLAKVVGSDSGSVTGRNLANIEEEFNLCPWTKSPAAFKKSYVGYQVPPEDSWRLPLLEKLLVERREMSTCGDDTSTITGLIDSLCVS